MNMEKVAQLAREMVKLEHSIAEHEEILKALKDAHRKIAEGDLPEMMESAGLANFTLADGRKVELKEEIYANISGDREEEAFAWLRENGHDDIIKRDLTITFGKGEDAKAQRIFDLLTKRKELADNTIAGRQTVHPSTLRAFVRRCLEAGMEIPQETFGVFRRTVAKVGNAKK